MWMYKGSRAFIASTNQRISKTEERLQNSECLKSVFKPLRDQYNRQDHVELFHEQMHFDKHINNHRIQKAARTIYLYGYPVFCNYFSTSELYNQFWCPETVGCILHQKNASPALLPANTKSSILSEYWPASKLITFSEIKVLSTFPKHSPNVDNVKNLIDKFECNCNMCLNRMNAIRSIVIKANRLVHETVKGSCAFQYSNMDAYPIERANWFYLLNLAHIILVIACLRGLM